MNRRSFFKFLPLLPLAGPSALLAIGVEEIDHPIYRYQYKDYYLRWTGWKGSMNHSEVVGQWLAVCRNDPQKMIYSSIPGACGFYFPGWVFDTTLQDAWYWRARKERITNGGAYERGGSFSMDDSRQLRVVDNSPIELKNDQQAQACRRIINFIDSYGHYDPNHSENRDLVAG